MAGPNLTNDTYVRGLFNTPPVGGTAARPLRFLTRQYPTEIKDFVEVFYDADRGGPDERGDDGSGMVVKANNAKRYRPGEWTTAPSLAFQDANTLTVTDNPPGGSDFRTTPTGTRTRRRSAVSAADRASPARET